MTTSGWSAIRIGTLAIAIHASSVASTVHADPTFCAMTRPFRVGAADSVLDLLVPGW